MNTTVYLFGKFNNGYTQYPDDYTSEIFYKFHENAKSTTQIAVHRDGNLMYYGYIRKLEQERYIGLCVVLNDLLLTRIDRLFSLFEDTISGLVTKGHLIHFNKQGDIVTNVETLYMNKEEIDLLNESLRAGFNHLMDSIRALPPISYGTAKDTVMNFVVDDDLGEIIKSSHTNGYTFIYKSQGFNTAQMDSYIGMLTQVTNLQKELEQLRAECIKASKEKDDFHLRFEQLQIENTKLNKEKKVLQREFEQQQIENTRLKNEKKRSGCTIFGCAKSTGCLIMLILYIILHFILLVSGKT